jgi:hypothetical protein
MEFSLVYKRIYINRNHQNITSIKHTLHRPKHKPKHNALGTHVSSCYVSHRITNTLHWRERHLTYRTWEG